MRQFAVAVPGRRGVSREAYSLWLKSGERVKTIEGGNVPRLNWYGAGNTQSEGTAREFVDRKAGVAGIGGASILRAPQWAAGIGKVR